MFSLVGKTAVVTGGGSGIGRAIAQTFARQGATVPILERGAVAGLEVAAAITVTGGTAHVVATDISKQAEVVAAQTHRATRFAG